MKLILKRFEIWIMLKILFEIRYEKVKKSYVQLLFHKTKNDLECYTNIVYHPMGYAKILARLEMNIARGDSRGHYSFHKQYFYIYIYLIIVMSHPFYECSHKISAICHWVFRWKVYKIDRFTLFLQVQF